MWLSSDLSCQRGSSVPFQLPSHSLTVLRGWPPSTISERYSTLDVRKMWLPLNFGQPEKNEKNGEGSRDCSCLATMRKSSGFYNHGN